MQSNILLMYQASVLSFKTTKKATDMIVVLIKVLDSYQNNKNRFQVQILQTNLGQMSGRNRQYNNLFKYVIVGDYDAGKSSLFYRLVNDHFQEFLWHRNEFIFKFFSCNSKNIKILIWDTPSSRNIVNTFYKSAHAVILVYDVTNLETFQSIENFWLNEVESYADPGAKLVLVGNKADMTESRVVQKQKAEAFAKQKGMIFFETSAKKDDDVNEPFMKVTSQLVKELQKTSVKKKQQLKENKSLGNQSQQDKAQGWCCCF